MKVGMYTGKIYSDGDKIEECCLNTTEIPTERKKAELKNKCLLCAIQCGFSSSCMPCRVMNENGGSI